MVASLILAQPPEVAGPQVVAASGISRPCTMSPRILTISLIHTRRASLPRSGTISSRGPNTSSTLATALSQLGSYRAAAGLCGLNHRTVKRVVEGWRAALRRRGKDHR